MRISRLLLVCSFGAALASAASLTGWISDASCGVNNARADKEARDCTASCLKNGAAAVLVTADNKVYKITGDVKVMDHLQHKVQVTGDVKDNTIAAKEIKKAD